MEIQFENRYTADVKTMVEFARKYRTYPRPAVAVPFGVVYTLMTLYILHYGMWDALIKVAIIMLLYCVFLAVYPYWHVWQIRREGKRNYNGVIQETVVQFGDNIQLFEGMMHLTMEYHKVIKVVRLKHSYCLMTSNRTAIMLREDGFTKGTFEEFKQFLRMKYPHLAIPE